MGVRAVLPKATFICGVASVTFGLILLKKSM